MSSYIIEEANDMFTCSHVCYQILELRVTYPTECTFVTSLAKHDGFRSNQLVDTDPSLLLSST